MFQPDITQYIIQIVKHGKIVIKHRKTAGTILLQTASTNTKKMQLFCNTHIYSLLLYNYAISPTRHSEIEEYEFHPEIDTRCFIWLNYQMQKGFLTKENQMPKHLPLKLH